MQNFCRSLDTFSKKLCQSFILKNHGVTEQLTLISRGSQPVVEYLATIRDIADELALIGAPVPNQYIITHTLNGVGPEFKELAAAVRARDTMISFDELHDKLVEYESFLKREELRSAGNLGNITANATVSLPQKMVINLARKTSKTTKEAEPTTTQFWKSRQRPWKSR